MDDRGFGGGTGKRGRKQLLADREAGPVAEFAHALGTLKLAAGDPSYEKMRNKLGATASKSALSAAARGRELPSWETTWEFVRCLAPSDTDLDLFHREWRARWDTARLGPAPPPGAGPAVVTPPGAVAPGALPPAAGPPASSGSAFEGRPPGSARATRSRLRRVAVGVLLGAVVAVVVWVVVPGDDPPVPPIKGDASTFVADVTIPDGTEVAVGQRFEKIWEIRNAGTVRWHGRYLMRQPDTDGTGCLTPRRVPVPDTRPERSVRISVMVVAAAPGPCKVRWKMVDEAGRGFFPSIRPVFFDVRVAG